MIVLFDNKISIFIPDAEILDHEPTLLTLLAMIDCELSEIPATKTEILNRIRAIIPLSEKSGTTVTRSLKKLQEAGLIFHKELGHMSARKKIGRGGKTSPYRTIFTLETTYDK